LVKEGIPMTIILRLSLGEWRMENGERLKVKSERMAAANAVAATV